MAESSYTAMERALALIRYRWEVHGDRFDVADELAAVEALQAEVAAFPAEHVPLCDLFPKVARLAAVSLSVLAELGDPDEVDGLHGFEGFTLWRDSR